VLVSRPCQGTAAVAPHSGLSLDGMAVRRNGVLNEVLDKVAFAACFVAACASNAPARAMEQQAAHTCGGSEVARGTVSRILDGRTFVLDDGREIRLAAIEVPPASLPSNASEAADGKASTLALNALAGADRVVLRSAEIASDRYGRLVAYAYTIRDGDELFVQGELVADGFARVGDRVGRDCAGELLSREKMARKARLGLWADPYYDVLNVETPVDVPAQRGRFALIEGTVTSVRESGATIYVNFGRRRSEDITVTVPKRNERTFAAAGLDLKTLAGRRIRVRGWVEQRGVEDRAWIAAERPEQIESTNGE
jgi:endonuclease YncB( thermonuclease family)